MKKSMIVISRKALLMTLIVFIAAMSGFAQVAFTHSDEVFQAPPSRSGLPLYNQMEEISYSAIVSMEAPNAPEYTSFAADDFIIPEGETWSINYVEVAGQYGDGLYHEVPMVNLFVYTDDDGKPGTFLYTFTGLTNINQSEFGETSMLLEIILPSGINLPEGHYWISVQVIDNSDNVGLWRWHQHIDFTIDNEFHWKNPLDGFGQGATDWTAASWLVWSDFNLAFALYGEGLPNDLSTLSVEMPVTAPNLTATETVSIRIKNEGLNTQTGFDVSYQIDGGAIVTENVGALALNANEIATYTFTTTADLSVPGQYEITGSTDLSTDSRPENNSASKSMYNLGEVYTMPATGTSTITTCGATFTDSGGLDGDFGDFDNATTTIYPANEGDMVILTFLTFDASWGGFSVYNGTDMTAPLLGTWNSTNSPGVLYALNPEGALTVHFEGPQWEHRPGWSAFISCFTPVPDDFAVLELTCDIPTMFVGDDAILSANIQNYGTTAQSKVVTFKANNVVIGTQTTPVLNTGDTAWVSIVFSPVDPGNFTIVASVPEDDGLIPNNSATIEKYVYPFGTFFESFEGPVFVPENWSQDGNWTQRADGSEGIYCAEAFVNPGVADTLITPRLEIHDGDILSFNAKTSPWWVGNLEIWWKNEENGVWSYIETVEPLGQFAYGEYDVDVSAAAGVNRIGFMVNLIDPWSWQGDVFLDNIVGLGITIYRDDNDLKAQALTGSNFYNVNEETNFQFVVRNDGLLDIPQDAYTVNLMSSDGVLASVPGQFIEAQRELTYGLSYTFTEISDFPVYAEIVYAADQYPVNNTSNSIMLTGLAGGSDVIGVGVDGEYWNGNPIDFSYFQSLAESLYQNTDIGQTGVIFGITYEYNFAEPVNDAPVRIWVGETDQDDFYHDENYNYEWIPATELTLVYDGTLDYMEGENTIYIPFQTPYHYWNANKNLVIMTERIDSLAPAYYTNQFYNHLSNNSSSMFMSGGDWVTIDPYAPSGGWGTGTNPNIQFIFNPNLGIMQGLITEIDGTLLGDVEVVVDELGITATTDASGFYVMPYVPAGSYQATASKYEYLPVTQNAEITIDNITNLDFVIGLLDMLSVSGRVVGNDDPTAGLANASVVLDGYANYSATTDESGYFTIDNIYSNNNYSIEVSSNGYGTYSNNVLVNNENVDLDDIVLSEILTIPYVVVGEDELDYAHISWQDPNADASSVLAFDDGVNEDGFAGEPNEEVWLGDYFPITELSTVTSFDIYWATYNIPNNPQAMRLDLFDEDMNLIVSSEGFMSGEDEWVNVSIPNLTLQGNYYVMVRWSGLFSQSTFLAWDTASVNTPNYAYYFYEGGTPQPLSDLVGKPGTFLIHANVMTGDARSEDAMVGFNIYRGLLADINNANNWPSLNSEMITGNTYDDYTWPELEDGTYVYAIGALYTTGESELSFSNSMYNTITGIEPASKLNYSVYPNPAKTQVNIKGCKETKIYVYGPQGKLIMSREISDDNYILNVSSLSSGMYSLIIQSNTDIVQQKLIIVR